MTSAEQVPTGLTVLDISPDDHLTLSKYGIGDPPQWSAWAFETRTEAGWAELIVTAQLASVAPITLKQFNFSVDNGAQTLDAYFAALSERIADIADSDIEKSQSEHFVILNLAPLHLARSLLDKIIRGLFFSAAANRYSQNIHIVLVLRNIDWLLKSEVFKQLVREHSLAVPISVLDLRGYGATYLAASGLLEFDIDRSIFRQILCTRQDHIYKSLIYETNAYIGHFALSNSHVRTHYELSEFIARDDAWEYILEKLLEVVGEATSIFVVGTGLEDSAVRRLGDQFKSAISDDRPVTVCYVSDTASLPTLVASWSGRFSLGLVVGDIVNTGTTLESVVQIMRSANTEGKPIRVFAIAKMQNSPSNIDGVPLSTGIEIRRTFYPNSCQDCPLCQLNQPLVEIRSVRDFATILDGQLTPLDFWELIKDSGALREHQQDSQRRPFAYRVDTHPVVRRYHRWLENLIRHKADAHWGETRPNLICTVKEDTGVQFAHLVAKALSTPQVVPVPREVLERVTPAGVALLPDITNLIPHGARVLLVDDGVNYGTTLRSLITVCRLANASLMGCLVLDSRLDEHETRRFNRMMGGGASLVALYTWQAVSPEL